MNEQTKNAIAEHAIAAYPHECCGLILLVGADEIYRPCANTAAAPTDQFVMSAEDFADAEDAGEVVALVHSHPGAPAAPSAADRTICEASGIKSWVIVAVGVMPDGEIGIHDWCQFGPSGYVAPLLGRPFVHGVHDCYSIIRDWYQQERGVTLPDFDRSDNWWADGKSSLYLDNFAVAGFVDVGQAIEPQAGDVLLMQIRSKNGVPNHAGVYLGNNVLLHHMYGQLSRRTVWGGMWAQSLYTVLRYKGDGSV